MTTTVSRQMSDSIDLDLRSLRVMLDALVRDSQDQDFDLSQRVGVIQAQVDLTRQALDNFRIHLRIG